MVVGCLVAMFLVVYRSDVPTYAGGSRLAGRLGYGKMWGSDQENFSR